MYVLRTKGGNEDKTTGIVENVIRRFTRDRTIKDG